MTKPNITLEDIMNWFDRKPKEKLKVETALGTFVFDDAWWSTQVETPRGQMTIFILDKTFEPEVVAKAQTVISELPSWSEKALAYVKADRPNTLTGYGKITPHALDVTDLLKGDFFSIGYLFENWPDGELTVVFRDGTPVEIWEDD